MEKIDFVIIWVDDTDPKWIKEKNYYAGNISGKVDTRKQRYRDWDNLKYWFRGVDKFAPWVNKIYFVTCGHVPNWLNLKAEKLVHISHSDYMKKEFLPTFNANPIEINLCFIEELSEQFVFFNDDTFLCKPVKKDLYFRKGLPVYSPRLMNIRTVDDGVMPFLRLNDLIAVNRNFKSKKTILDNWYKWFSPLKIGIKGAVENLFYFRLHYFPGFFDQHLPVPLLKSTLLKVWQKENDLLYQTSMHKFRDVRDVNQYLFRYWQLASGQFVSENPRKLGSRLRLTKDNSKIYAAIEKQSYPMICINDNELFDNNDMFEKTKKELIASFSKILPDKSSYEL